MKEINLEVLKDAASRLLFTMSEKEYQTLLSEFSVVIKQMETIGKIEGVDDYEPMTFPFECSTDYLREDEPSTSLAREDVLMNAGSVLDNQIKLPKVVG